MAHLEGLIGGGLGPGESDACGGRVEPYPVSDGEPCLGAMLEDRRYREYLVNGFVAGFRVGFQYGKKKCASATANM